MLPNLASLRITEPTPDTGVTRADRRAAARSESGRGRTRTVEEAREATPAPPVELSERALRARRRAKEKFLILGSESEFRKEGEPPEEPPDLPPAQPSPAPVRAPELKGLQIPVQQMYPGLYKYRFSWPDTTTADGRVEKCAFVMTVKLKWQKLPKQDYKMALVMHVRLLQESANPGKRNGYWHLQCPLFLWDDVSAYYSSGWSGKPEGHTVWDLVSIDKEIKFAADNAMWEKGNYCASQGKMAARFIYATAFIFRDLLPWKERVIMDEEHAITDDFDGYRLTQVIARKFAAIDAVSNSLTNPSSDVEFAVDRGRAIQAAVAEYARKVHWRAKYYRKIGVDYYPSEMEGKEGLPEDGVKLEEYIQDLLKHPVLVAYASTLDRRAVRSLIEEANENAGTDDFRFKRRSSATLQKYLKGMDSYLYWPVFEMHFLKMSDALLKDGNPSQIYEPFVETLPDAKIVETEDRGPPPANDVEAMKTW